MTTKSTHAQPYEFKPGKFPKLTPTLRAEALATLLASDDVAGLESVFANGATNSLP